MSIAAATIYKISPEEQALAFQQLGGLVAIPSVSDPNSPDYSEKTLQKAADYVTPLLANLTFRVRQVRIQGSAPFVLGEKIVDPEKPSILLYAHYDKQPVDRTEWKTDPFVMTELDGRLYGRG